MKKHIVLVDCYENRIELTEKQAKKYVADRNTNMFWAVCQHQNYKEGDWVEVAFFPAYNWEWDEQSQETVFCPYTWDDDDHGPLTVTRHYFHGDGFASPWESDPWSWYEKPWIVDEE